MAGSVTGNSCFLHSPLCHFLVSDSSPLVPFSYTRNARCRRKNRATMACLQRENSKQSDICARRAILFMGFVLFPFLGTRADAVDGYVVGWNRRGRLRSRRSIEKDTELRTQENTESRTQENSELRTQESTDSRTEEGTQESTELKTQDRIPNAEQTIKEYASPSPNPTFSIITSIGVLLSGVLGALYSSTMKDKATSDATVESVKIAKAYEKGGAACLSVLTDEKYFQGSFENLEAIRSSGVLCPLLCKEFVIDAWQIYYARVKGADAILLIAAVLPDLDIKYMTKICKLLGLTALVEVHDEREMDRVLEIEGIELVGINNRDLGTFKVDIGNTKRLLEGERGQRIREKGIIVVGESGLFTPADIAYIQDAGVKAVLVGESIVKQTDPCMGITQLFGGYQTRTGGIGLENN